MVINYKELKVGGLILLGNVIARVLQILVVISGGGQVLKLWNIWCLVPWWCHVIYPKKF